MKTYTEERYTYTLAGFPVVLENVEIVQTAEGEFPLLDHEAVNRRILLSLARQPSRLTGNQARYIRHSMELGAREFAEHLRIAVTRVHAWEKRGNLRAGMGWLNELRLRAEVLLRYAIRQ